MDAQKTAQEIFNRNAHKVGSWLGDRQVAMDCALYLIGDRDRAGKWYTAENGVQYFISDCGEFCLSLWQNFPRAFVCKYTA